MYDSLSIEYLIYFFEYLDDTVFKDLLEFIYEKKGFSIEPFSTYKEFFLYLLINDKSKIKYKTEITYEKLVNEKKEIVDLLKDKKEININSCKNNKYYLLKSEYEKVNKLSKTLIKSDDISTLLDFYNNKFIPITNADSRLLQYIGAIALSIKYFFYRKKYPPQREFKQLLNYIVKKEISEKCCYGIYKEDYDTNDLYLIQRTSLYPVSDNMCTIVNNYYIIKDNNQLFITDMNRSQKIPFYNFVDLYTLAEKDIKYYKKLIKASKHLIKELDKKLEKRDYCHICNPYDNPEKNTRKQKCQKCKKIYDLIIKIDPNQTSNSIGGRIKRRVKEEKYMSYKAKKERHYKNLREFIAKLEKNKEKEELLKNVNTGLNKEKFNQLYRLIDNVFGKDTD